MAITSQPPSASWWIYGSPLLRPLQFQDVNFKDGQVMLWSDTGLGEASTTNPRACAPMANYAAEESGRVGSLMPDYCARTGRQAVQLGEVGRS